MAAENIKHEDIKHQLPAARSDLEYSGYVDGRVTVFDPVNDRNFAMSVSAVAVLQALDGHRTASDIAALLAEVGTPVAAEDVVVLVRQAKALGLLVVASEGSTAIPGAAVPQGHLQGPTRRNPLFFKVFEIDPTGILDHLMPLTRWLFSRVAAGLQVFGALYFVTSLAGRWDEVGVSMMRFRHPVTYPLLVVFTAIITVLHEFGHALATRCYGGRVRRMGLALYLLIPAGFVDTSSAWRFSQRRDRIVVSLAGMHVEGHCVTLLTAIATLSPAGWARDLAWITALVCAARILANLNPFLRLDGYWVLSDAIGITNLRAKSFRQLLSCLPVIGRGFRGGKARPSREERSFLLVYAIASVLNVAIGVIAAGWLVGISMRNWLGVSDNVVSWVGTVVAAFMAIIGARSYAKSLKIAISDVKSAEQKASKC